MNKVDPQVGLDDVADFTDIQAKRRFLKRRLHLSSTKETKVTLLIVGRAIAFGLGQFLQLDLAVQDPLLESSQLDDGFVASQGDAIGTLPQLGSPQLGVLDQQVRRSHLAVLDYGTVAVLLKLAQVLLELVFVGAERRLPQRLPRARVIEVLPVMRSRDLNRPSRRKSHS